MADSGAVAIWEEFWGSERLRSGNDAWAEFGPEGVCARATGYTTLRSMFTQSLVMLMVSLRELLRGFEVSGALDLVFGVEATGGVGWVTSYREVEGMLVDAGELEYSVGTETFEMAAPFGRLIGDVFNHVVSGFGFLNLSPVDEQESVRQEVAQRWTATSSTRAFWEEKGILIAGEAQT